MNCEHCLQDLTGKDVEYHYSRMHGVSSMDIPKQMLLMALRDAQRLLREAYKKAGQ